ncbi:Ku protein [Streptomyces sp. NPDC058964]|uniref:non-homologous end joining protein Ku n=1 Tax=Streptomyces sp. NPDC058964 TaxID=3346681 RepID=UPI0036C36D97
MPRTIWNGAISFGLVTVPIHVVSATEDHSVRFHQYHREDMGRVRVRKFCELEDREVRQDEIGKGYELTKTQVIPVSEEELRNLPLPTAKAIEILGFVPWESIDALRIGDGYYLQPDGQVAVKPYELLRRALERSARVAVAKFAWSGRERLGLLRVRGPVLVLHAMRWPDEVRSPAGLSLPTGEVAQQEIDEALNLIEGLSTDRMEGEDFVDHYTQALEAVIEAKREHHAPPQVPEPSGEPGQVLDLMAALQESVAQARASRGEESEAEVHEMPQKKPTAKKSAAEKPAAGKKTAKKTATKTAAAKKTATGKTAAKKTTPHRPRSA